MTTATIPATPLYDQALADWSLRPDPPTRPLGAVHVVPRLDTVCPFCGSVLVSLRTSPCICPREFAGAGRDTVARRQLALRGYTPRPGEYDRWRRIPSINPDPKD